MADALRLPTTTAIASILNLSHPDRRRGSLGDRGPRRHPLLVRRGGAKEERTDPDAVSSAMLHQGISTRIYCCWLCFSDHARSRRFPKQGRRPGRSVAQTVRSGNVIKKEQSPGRGRTKHYARSPISHLSKQRCQLWTHVGDGVLIERLAAGICVGVAVR